MTRQELRDRIDRLLRQQHEQSDRSIARQLGCDPQTVGRRRRALFGEPAAPTKPAKPPGKWPHYRNLYVEGGYL